MGLLSNRESSRAKAARRITDGNGFIVHSAEASRYYGADRPLPKPQIDERAAEAAKAASASLVHLELSEELSETWSCFEEVSPDGNITGRLWVRREPLDVPEI